ncbi:ATP-binding cassette domain-containing protein [Chryseobacterium sp. RP-3-3]|uniref:ATP-binding cassette domain-containing protein n=1 Tax=Chryseobacterium antibioticum TaxID=2728847 RepID=A0A7Y0AL56_9FLAO|nr:ABC transporter ATP-binding protein [Chryseobacterium antibioticum]NML69381.1 ATP-binding cassette domain-containing protein [Chryseobacterium antibioticum]
MLALKAENISKQYRLGQVGTGTLSHDLNRLWYTIRGKEDPYLKIGEANDRTTKGTSEYVWSLRDIDFEITQGDAVGIIGKNGAGKSTLLKLLSKVTKPTTGKIYTKGRIASLLEVGTGFHPEMTGRENVYLNGAILGMTRKEITRKFDEIVAFSGVERYIDTPVKRYSSGMYVRLAFAVAAHLESEILIVDEVLAVGDADFQKKCLGKMGDVTKGEGRTVLFVSHNMAAVRRLCQKGILLKQGSIVCQDNMENVLNRYDLEFRSGEKNFEINYPSAIDAKMQINRVKLAKPNDHHILFTDDDLIFEFDVTTRTPVEDAYITIDIKDQHDELIYWTSDYTSQRYIKSEKGEWKLQCKLPKGMLTQGYYVATFAIYSPLSNQVIHYMPNFFINFELEENENSYLQQFGIIRPGKIGLQSDWNAEKK